jgi:hypothetical protein
MRESSGENSAEDTPGMFSNLCRTSPVSSFSPTESSPEEFVKFRVRTDPNPGYDVARTFSDGTDVEGNAHRPNVVISGEFFEAKRIVRRIFAEKAIGASSRLLVCVAQHRVGAPE